MQGTQGTIKKAINQAIGESHTFGGATRPKYPYADGVKVPDGMVRLTNPNGVQESRDCDAFIGVHKSDQKTCTGNAYKEYDMFKQIEEYNAKKASGAQNVSRDITIQCKPEFGNIKLDAEAIEMSRKSFRVYVNEDRHNVDNEPSKYNEKTLNWNPKEEGEPDFLLEKRVGSGNIHVHDTIGFLERDKSVAGDWKPAQKPFNMPVITISMPNASKIEPTDPIWPGSDVGIDRIRNNCYDAANKNLKRIADVAVLERMDALCVPPIGFGAFGELYREARQGTETSTEGVARSSLTSLITRFSELRKQGANVPELIISSGYLKMAGIDSRQSQFYKEVVGDMADKVRVTDKDLIEVATNLNKGGTKTAFLNGGNQYGTDIIDGRYVVGNRAARNSAMGLTDEDFASVSTLRMTSPRPPYGKKEMEEYVNLVRGKALSLKREIEKNGLKFESETITHTGLDSGASKVQSNFRSNIKAEYALPLGQT